MFRCIWKNPSSRLSCEDIKSLGKTLADLCLAYIPLAGTTYPDEAQELGVVEEIAVRDTRHAQVVVYHPDGRSKTYISKVFYPLYYMYTDEEFQDYQADTFLNAYKDYTNEAGACATMQTWPMTGRLIRKYSASWIFELTLDTASSQ
ncbi:hypothetical protein PpBr36_08552 [Pyricularia pennisetigena]|uniref:hypothetical protein n=1 Tax=Pyricularia pennisetigena TaxID=1578925 RepID=UPI001151A905|nr:hypothetical protein PpBr36_08552 [Pyricularia pennisetigena]TLS24937.1 hypothetical protein PpBr36_08552 [Pyricularia pennisetigena]